jgi:hypothetical protein
MTNEDNMPEARPEPLGETLVQIPVEFRAVYKDGVITRFVVSPLESYAGYFGNGSFIEDGPDRGILIEPDDGSQSPFWRAVSAAFTFGDPPRHHEATVIVHWEE